MEKDLFHDIGHTHRHGRGDHHHQNTVAALRDGEKATIVGVHGGGRLEARLANMGLRPGKTIKKLAALPGHGPITVEVDGRQVAFGHGVARKVLIERLSEPPEDTA